MATINHLALSILFVAAAVAIADCGTLPALGQTQPAQLDSVAGSSVTKTAPAFAMSGGRIFLDPDREVFQAKLPWDQDDEDVAENPEEANPYHDIKMHGHWIIDVKNPDGTLAEHRDFENALQPTGASFIFGLLSGYYSAGDYVILLAPQSGNGACSDPLGAQGCTLLRSAGNPHLFPFCSTYLCATGLSSTLNSGAGGYNSLTLSGAITANQTGTIGTVSTLVDACSEALSSPTSIIVSKTTPAACQNGTGGSVSLVSTLSFATITPIAVTPGQLVQVTVIITFS